MGPALVVLAAGMARRYGGCKPLAPIGPNGEAVIDLLVSDAVAAGFGQIVLVLHPETGPAIRYHVERCWPTSIEVSFVEQRLPLGTVHAVLAARPVVAAGQSFAVSNADDVYGEVAMGQLATQLGASAGEHALIGYRLRATVATDDPVTRGICEVDDAGYLVALHERRHVVRDGADGFRSDDRNTGRDVIGCGQAECLTECGSEPQIHRAAPVPELAPRLPSVLDDLAAWHSGENLPTRFRGLLQVGLAPDIDVQLHVATQFATDHQGGSGGGRVVFEDPSGPETRNPHHIPLLASPSPGGRVGIQGI